MSVTSGVITVSITGKLPFTALIPWINFPVIGILVKKIGKITLSFQFFMDTIQYHGKQEKIPG